MAALIALHRLPTGYSPVRDAVSLYGASDYRWLYQAEVVALGVAGGVLAAGLSRFAVPRSGLIALTLYAASRLLIAAFPVGRDHERITPATAAHLGLAAVTFLSSAVAIWILTGALATIGPWNRIAGLLQVLMWLVVLSTGATFASNALPATRPFFGLIERGWYATSIAWMTSVAVLMSSA